MNEKKKQPQPKDLVVNGMKLTTNQQKCEAFANHLANCNRINPTTNAWSNKLEQDPFHLERSAMTEDLKENLAIRVDELERILKDKKSKSAPGVDGITYKDLKNAPTELKELICQLINGCLWLSTTPERWKQTIVKMIPKGNKDPTKVTNYRPISLISCLGKILESKVKETIMKHCIGNEVFGESQYAYLSGKGTQDSLTRLSNEIATTITRRGTTAVAFMDVEKAFDSVWHKGLLYKMKDLKLPNHLIIWTMDYLENRKVQINHSGALSEPFQPTAGVPQGSTVSPVFFIIYVSKPSITRCKILQFADDIALVNQWKTSEGAKNGLLRGMDELNEWCSKWRIKLNPGKTQVMLFNWKLEGTNPPIYFNNSILQQPNEIKFLGLTFQKRLQWTRHIEETNKKMRAKVAQLHKLRTRGVSAINLTKLYKGLIRLHMGYCTTAWANIPKSLVQKLQFTQNEALRTILGKPPWTRIEDLHKETRIPLVADFLRKLNNQYITKNQEKRNPQVEHQLKVAESLKGVRKWKTPMIAILEYLD